MTGQKPNQEPPEQGGGTSPGKGGDLSVALKEERTKRQTLQEQNESLQQQIDELKAQSARAGAGEEEIDEIITDDDLANLDAKAINEKLKKALSPLRDLSKSLNDIRQRQATKEEREKTEAILDQYDIFQSDDEDLADEARLALETRVKRLAEQGKTGETALKEAAESVVKRFSRFAANKAAPAGDDDDDEEELAPPGGGSAADAAHAKPEPPTNPKDAKKRAHEIAAGLLKRK